MDINAPHIADRPLLPERGTINVSKLDYSVKMDMKFRRIVLRAMEDQGIRDIDDKCDFIKWAIGTDFANLPYQKWPYRLADRVKLLNINMHSSIYWVIRSAAEIWKRKRLVIGQVGLN